MNSNTSNIDISIKGFDFNQADIKFIEGQFQAAIGQKVGRLANDLHWWGKESAANPRHSVDFTLKMKKIGSVIESGYETTNVQFADTDIGPMLTASLAFGIELSSYKGNVAIQVPVAEALGYYDIAYASAKESVPAGLRSSYYSLRSKIAMAASLASEAYIQPSSMVFVINEGDKQHVFKVMSDHLIFVQHVAKDDTPGN